MRSSDRRVLCWGEGGGGTVGDGSTSDNTVPGLTSDTEPYIGLAMEGWVIKCGVREDGQSTCWGWASGYRLGDGQSSTDSHVPKNTSETEPFGLGFKRVLHGGPAYSAPNESLTIAVLGNKTTTFLDNWTFSCRIANTSGESAWVSEDFVVGREFSVIHNHSYTDITWGSQFRVTAGVFHPNRSTGLAFLHVDVPWLKEFL